MKTIADLIQYDFFAGLKHASVQTLYSLGVQKRYKSGRILCYQNDPAQTAFFILEGEIECIKHLDHFASLLFSRLKPGDWICVSETLLQGPYLCDVKTATEVLCLEFPRLFFQSKMLSDEIMLRFLKTASREIYKLHTKIAVTLPDQKIAQFLSENCTRKGSAVQLTITQEAIAYALGLSRETVNKYLKIFERSGYIELHRSSITIVDREALQNL